MRTAFICMTVTVTSPLERIYISARVTRRPFGFQAKGSCLSRSGNRPDHFRCYFAMGKIRGTPCMRSHISVHRVTTKYFSNSFVFKTEIEKEGLPGDITPAWSTGVLVGVGIEALETRALLVELGMPRRFWVNANRILGEPGAFIRILRATRK
jgi:hypothetical protein